MYLNCRFTHKTHGERIKHGKHYHSELTCYKYTHDKTYLLLI